MARPTPPRKDCRGVDILLARHCRILEFIRCAGYRQVIDSGRSGSTDQAARSLK